MHLPPWSPEINFAFSQKLDGGMSFKREPLPDVLDNRRRFLKSNGHSLESVVAGELIHGSVIAIVREADKGRGASTGDWLPGVDGLVTDAAGILLLTTHADCAPVVIYDDKHHVIGQAHAGWRGLRAGIIENLARAVRSFNGSDNRDLKVWIGPTVGPCCYPVGAEVAAQFPAECSSLVAETQRLDLVRFIKIELARIGCDPAGVSDSGVCTSCDKRFSSFRRDGMATKAMALVTGLKPN